MNQTIVLTGANRGLGLALARAFAGRGDTVIAGCRNPAAATELTTLTRHVHPIDTGSEESIAAFAAVIGDQPVDVLINNAGIDARNLGAADHERDVLVQPVDHLLGEITVNTVGPLLLIRCLLPNLQAASNPRIVNVSSQVGSMDVGASVGRDLGYSVSKAALNMVTVKLGMRLRGEGVTAIALHPGYLKTDMGGAAAAMEPSDAAAAIAAMVDGLTIADTGTFKRWDGTTHPW